VGKTVSALYKPLPSKKLNQRSKNGATDLHPMAADFFLAFKNMWRSASVNEGGRLRNAVKREDGGGASHPFHG